MYKLKLIKGIEVPECVECRAYADYNISWDWSIGHWITSRSIICNNLALAGLCAAAKEIVLEIWPRAYALRHDDGIWEINRIFAKTECQVWFLAAEKTSNA